VNGVQISGTFIYTGQPMMFNTRNSTFDYVIVGSGVSGMTLAYYLMQGKLKDRSILIVDRDKDPDYNTSYPTVD